MVEVWKDIPGYEGCYQASNLGRIKSLDRDVYRGGIIKHISGCMMSLRETDDGRIKVDLRKDGFKKTFKVHRLVALAFLPNPDNLREVNHKDENPKNNRLDNLEWCTHIYNCKYGTRNERRYESGGGSRRKPIGKYDKDGNLVATYTCIKSAARGNNVTPSAIKYNAQTGAVSKKGYTFKFL